MGEFTPGPWAYWAEYLGRYVDEFAFQLNDGNVKRHTLNRLDSFILATAGKRLTYAELIG